MKAAVKVGNLRKIPLSCLQLFKLQSSLIDKQNIRAQKVLNKFLILYENQSLQADYGAKLYSKKIYNKIFSIQKKLLKLWRFGM